MNWRLALPFDVMRRILEVLMHRILRINLVHLIIICGEFDGYRSRQLIMSMELILPMLGI